MSLIIACVVFQTICLKIDRFQFFLAVILLQSINQTKPCTAVFQIIYKLVKFLEQTIFL